MFTGSFNASLFYLLGATFAILSLVIVYWQSQYYHHEPPFPHAYISKVCQHYPEYLVFRLSTVSGAVLIILGWFTNHFVLRTICMENGVNFNKYRPGIPLVFGIMGGLCLTGNTASIDTGNMDEQLHEFCARNFFIWTLIAQIYNIYICADLSKRTKAISKTNLLVKYLILLAIVLQVLDSTTAQFSWFQFSEVQGKDKGKFLEWTLTVTVISMFISIAMDAKPFEFVYTEVRAKEEIIACE